VESAEILFDHLLVQMPTPSEAKSKEAALDANASNDVLDMLNMSPDSQAQNDAALGSNFFLLHGE
jgi:hypothetical protein